MSKLHKQPLISFEMKKSSLKVDLLLKTIVIFILSFAVVSSIVVFRVRKYNRDIIIERSENEINTMLQVTANLNSVLMQQLRTYTQFFCESMSDPNEIQRTLIELAPKRYKDFMSISYVDYATGLQYNDDGTVESVSEMDYYKIMREQRKKNKPLQCYGDMHDNTWYSICKDNEAKDADGYCYGFFLGKTAIAYIQRFIDKLKKENSFNFRDGFFTIVNTDFKYVCAPDLSVIGKNFIEDKCSYLSPNVKNFIEHPVDRIGKNKVTENGLIVKNGKRYLMTVGMFTKTYNWILCATVPFDTIDSFASNLLFTIVVSFLVVAAISSAIFFLIFKRSFASLTVLNNKFIEIAKENVDLTKRIEVKDNNEIGEIEKSFNKYLQQLQSLMSDLKIVKNDLLNDGYEIESSYSKLIDLLAKAKQNEKDSAELEILQSGMSERIVSFYKNIDKLSKSVDSFET